MRNASLLVMLLWTFISSPVYAKPFILTSDDFESYVAGELLSKPAAGMRGAYGYGTENDGIYIDVDPVAADNKVVRLHKAALRGGSYLDVFARPGRTMTLGELLSRGQAMIVSYDLYISSANRNKSYVSIRTPSGMDNLVTLYFTPDSSGDISVQYAVAGDGEVGSKVRIPADQWHSVAYEIRPLDDGRWTFTARVTDRLTGETREVAEGVDVTVRSADAPSLNRLRFYQFGSPAGDNCSYIDNVVIAYRSESGGDQAMSSPKTPDPREHIEETVLIDDEDDPSLIAGSVSDAFRILEQVVITDKRSRYVGWPSAAILPSGEVLVVASGGRTAHACPFGRCYLYRSTDLGHTWEGPIQYWDGKLDDRDNGILVTSKGTIIANWFSSIAWLYHLESGKKTPAVEEMLEYGKTITLEDLKRESGYWMMRSNDGGHTWSEKYRLPVTTPHGPCELDDGSLLYVGYEASTVANLVGGRPATGGLVAARSDDDGQTWNIISQIPVLQGHRSYQYHEPHVVQANDGIIIAHIRKNYPKEALTLQVTSKDGGYTWTAPEEVYWGYPSHLLKLKDGRILVTYGYRKKPIGIRGRISSDNGKSWGNELILYDQAVSGDMGYPTTVQLPDGGLLTVWYERLSSTECVLKSLRWKLNN